MDFHERTWAKLDELFTARRFLRLYERVRADFRERNSLGHNWEHVKRVIVNAVYVAIEEKADMQIVLAAAILHDIGFVAVPEEPRRHNVHGSTACKKYLDEWSASERTLISNCILKHKGRYPGYGIEPETLEEKVVCDADQVDKFGWIGFLQVVKVYAEYGISGVEEFATMRGLAKGLSEAGGISLYTEAARRMAASLREPDPVSVARRLTEELAFSDGWKEPV